MRSQLTWLITFKQYLLSQAIYKLNIIMIFFYVLIFYEHAEAVQGCTEDLTIMVV